MTSFHCHQLLLSSCKNLSSLTQIHARIITSGYNFNIPIATHLINLYSSFKRSNFSRTLFDLTPNPPLVLWNSMIRAYKEQIRAERDVVVWNAMISGVAQCGEAVKAVELFKKMQIVCVISPSSVTLLNLLWFWRYNCYVFDDNVREVWSGRQS